MELEFNLKMKASIILSFVFVSVIAVLLCMTVACHKSPPLPGDASAPITLLQAAEVNNAKRVQKLLKSGSDVNMRNDNGVTPLMLAAVNNSVDVTRLLIKARADIEAKDMYGGTALMWAASGNAVDTAWLLIKAGADLETKGSVTEEGIELTPLMFAAGSNFVDVSKLLIESGADVNAWGVFGDDITPLMLAAYRNSADVAKLLIDAGADVSVANSNGLTALIIAEESGADEVIRLIRKNLAGR